MAGMKQGTKDRAAVTAYEPRELAAEPMLPAVAHQVTGGALILADPSALAAALASYSQSRTILLTWLDKNLTPGVDYMLIHRKIGPPRDKRDCPNKSDRTSKKCDGCGGKATLCKPGTEKLCGLLQLRPAFRHDPDTWAMLGKRDGVLCVICELVNTDGQVIAEGRGCRNETADYGDLNKTVKMVQKSAQTDAVLRVGGLSEVFTQDLEDQLPKDPTSSATASDPPKLTMPGKAEAAHGRAEKGAGKTKATPMGEGGAVADGTSAAPVLTLTAEGGPTMTVAEWRLVKALAKEHQITSGMLRLWLAGHDLRFNEPTELPVAFVEGLRLRAEGRLEDADAAIQAAKADIAILSEGGK